MLTKKLDNSQISRVNHLTAQAVADWARVSTKTVYLWISDNKSTLATVCMSNRSPTFQTKFKISPNYPLRFSKDIRIRVKLD